MALRKPRRETTMLLERLAICQSEFSSQSSAGALMDSQPGASHAQWTCNSLPQLARAEGLAVGNKSQLVAFGCFRRHLQAGNRRGHDGDDLLNKAILRTFVHPGSSLCGTTTDQERSPPRPDHQPTASRLSSAPSPDGASAQGRWSCQTRLVVPFRSNNSWRESIPAVVLG
jgi:hypothetical protein